MGGIHSIPSISRLMLKAADLDRKDASSVIETSMFFMKRDALHAEEKPYAYRYAAEIDIPRSNFVLQKYDHITIKDIRSHLDDFSLEKNGFTILKMTDEIPYEAYFDPFKVEAYFRQLEAILQQHLQASFVQVFRHAVRLSNTQNEGKPLTKQQAP